MSLLYTVASEKAERLLHLPDELPGRPAGYTGAPLIAGRVNRDFEHNNEWSAPRARALLVGRMLRTSPILSLAEEYLTGRVTAVSLSVIRNENTSEEAAEAVERWLGVGKYQDSGSKLGNDLTMELLLQHLMSARVYGNCAMAESWHYDEDADLYWCNLHRRRQESYDRYITEAGTDRLVSLVQRVTVNSGNIESRTIPMGQMLWLVHRPDIGWHDGRSVLRPVYGNWRSTQMRLALEDVLAARYAAPPQRGKLDIEKFAKFAAGESGGAVTREDYINELAHMQTQLKDLHSHENAHILYPDWWSFEEMSRQHNYTPDPILSSIAYHERACAERLYIAWVIQGREANGSRSMVETQSRVIDDATIDVLQWCLGAINRQTLRRFMKVNFSGLSESEYPILSFERGSVIAPWWQRNAQSFASFVQNQILSISPEDERAIRAASELPPPADDTPSTVDRLATQVGGRLRTPAGQREASQPGSSARTSNRFVDRLVEADD